MNRTSHLIGLVAFVVAAQAQAADAWRQVTKPPLPSAEIQLVKMGEDKGVVWIGTPSGALKVEGGVFRLLAPTKDLIVWDVTKRPEGGLWVGHSTGALLVDGDRTVKALNGLNVATIQQVGAKLWAIAKDESKDRNTLMQADGDEWAPVPSMKDRRVLDLVKDAKGVFWLVLDGDGVMEVDPKKAVSEVRQHLPRMNVTSILTDTQGHTWCGLMSGGVMVRQATEWRRHLDRENSAVLSLVEDGTGKVWAATSGNGIWVYDGTNAWNGMLQDEGQVNLLKMTSDKRIWVSTQRHGGLRYWNGTEWKDSLGNPDALRSLLELPGGVLVAGSNRDGVYILGDYSIKGEAESDGKRKD